MSRGRKPKDISGEKFGKLTAKKYKPGGRWLCKCDCGNETSVHTGSLTSGNTKSCGCLQKQIATRIGYESRE